MEWASAFEADPTKRISSRRFTGCWLRSVVVISRVSEVVPIGGSDSWGILCVPFWQLGCSGVVDGLWGDEADVCDAVGEGCVDVDWGVECEADLAGG